MELQLHTGDIGNYLKNHDIKPSYQRMKIFQYLLDNHVHPTVDTIYKALCPEIPTLSKTTVYNTLNLFSLGWNASGTPQALLKSDIIFNGNIICDRDITAQNFHGTIDKAEKVLNDLHLE